MAQTEAHASLSTPTTACASHDDDAQRPLRAPNSKQTRLCPASGAASQSRRRASIGTRRLASTLLCACPPWMPVLLQVMKRIVSHRLNGSELLWRKRSVQMRQTVVQAHNMQDSQPEPLANDAQDMYEDVQMREDSAIPGKCSIITVQLTVRADTVTVFRNIATAIALSLPATARRTCRVWAPSPSYLYTLRVPCKERQTCRVRFARWRHARVRSGNRLFAAYAVMPLGSIRLPGRFRIRGGHDSRTTFAQQRQLNP